MREGLRISGFSKGTSFGLRGHGPNFILLFTFI